VLQSSQSEQSNRQDTATSAAIGASLALRSVILGAVQPVITLGTLVATQQPEDWDNVLSTFYGNLPGIYNLSQSETIINLQLLPR
jgi:hypothetical protein